ncbi:hypothetical protein MNBD_NITROSPINAE01-193 [hydrothermal vent metagenome]|uniref:TfoX N-terminal domain-containing protein n=1 Tax=hydrothermal vent metagenome TaxID=652676 RepID=A0A3B1BMJ4_9ZZZZ
MKEKYQAQLVSLVDKLRPRLLAKSEIEFRPLFGAVAGYYSGNIFITCGKFGMALRLPSRTILNLFEQKNGRPLKYFENGHVKKEYVILDKGVLGDTARMRYLLKVSLQFSAGDRK